jgi:hypothetical protein
MSNWIPKEKLTAYQRWEVAAFDEQASDADAQAGKTRPPETPPADPAAAPGHPCRPDPPLAEAATEVEDSGDPQAPAEPPLVLPTAEDIEAHAPRSARGRLCQRLSGRHRCRPGLGRRHGDFAGQPAAGDDRHRSGRRRSIADPGHRSRQSGHTAKSAPAAGVAAGGRQRGRQHAAPASRTARCCSFTPTMRRWCANTWASNCRTSTGESSRTAR